MNPTNTQNPNNPNQYNPQTGNLVLNNSNTGIGNQPPVIPAGVGLGSVQPAQPAQPPQQNATTNANANNASLMTQPQFEAQTNQNVQNYGQAYQQSSQDYQQQILNQINNRENQTNQIQQATGYTNALSNYNAATAKYQSLNDEFALKKKAVLTNQSLTAEDQQRRLNAVNVEETIAKTDAIIDYNMKKGSFDTIKDLTDQKINIMLEGDKLKIEALKQQKEDNKDLFTRAEDKQFNLMIKKQEQAFQEKQDKLKFQQQLQLKAMEFNRDLQIKGIDKGLTAEQLNSIKTPADLAKFIGTDAKTVEKTFDIEEKIKSIDDIIGNKSGIRGSVGPTRLQRGGILTVIPRGKLNADIQQLISQTTLDNLINAKAKGATFGALSEGELKLLSASGSKLATWAITDKNGNITGFKASEQQVRDELNKIKSYAVRDYEITTGQPYKTQTDPAGLGIDVTQYDPAGLGI